MNVNTQIACMCAKSLQLCPTLCDRMDCSLPAPLSMDSPGKNMSCHALLQGIFLTQGSNPSLLKLLHCRWILCHGATREAKYTDYVIVNDVGKTTSSYIVITNIMTYKT